MSTEAFIAYMRTYVGLTDQEEALILSHTKKRTYLKNQYIVQQGDVCKTSNFILKGCTKMFYADENGQQHVVNFAIENWWTSDLGSFISQQPADFNVQCIEDTEVIQFTYNTLENLYQSVPKLERLFRKIVERAFVASQQRIVRNFSLDAKARYLIFKTNYPEIIQRVPQYLIASYLGISKEFLSKIKAQLLQ